MIRPILGTAEKPLTTDDLEQVAERYKVAIIAPPHEILDLGDGESVEFRVTKWEQGIGLIFPDRAPYGVITDILRVHVPEEDKEFVPYFWDITSRTLIAGFKPILEAPDWRRAKFRITKIGIPPHARFRLRRIPIA